ncbi:unnamed protein product, partial [marine sediment metagenome]
MLRMPKYPLLALAVCLIAAPLSRANGETKEDAKAVVAVFAFDRPMLEKPRGEDFPLFSSIKQPTLKDVVQRLKKAKDDNNVKAVVLLLDEVSLNLAQIEELCQALDGIKAAGKEVYAHVDSAVTMRTLVLAAGASRISATPTTIIMITGFNAESPYVRGLLDMIGVKPDFLTCGEYKSAAEIFMRTGPSPEAVRMRNWLLDSLYESYLKTV